MDFQPNFFVDRNTEISSALSETNNVLILGAGGMGKTSLVYRYAELNPMDFDKMEIVHASHFDTIKPEPILKKIFAQIGCVVVE